jgi:cellulose synthase/poly-beta-1,6-N-acetylglucosamine synthase-like glycosyltransferase
MIDAVDLRPEPGPHADHQVHPSIRTPTRESPRTGPVPDARQSDRSDPLGLAGGPVTPTPFPDHGIRRELRRIATLLALTPLIFVLAGETPKLLRSPLTIGYGSLVLLVTIVLIYVAYAHYEDPSLVTLSQRPGNLADFPVLPAQPRVSFLLAVKDEVANIETCVRSIVDSDYRPMQIIVVDDGSTDGTSEVLDRLAERFDFLVVHLRRNVGKKNALVQAAVHADGDVFAFTDSDCRLAPDAVRRCVEAMLRHPELGAVSGHTRAMNATESLLSRVQDVWYEGQFRIAKGAESTFGSVTCVSGPLAVFRREAILNYLPAWAGDRFLGGEFRFATDRQLTGYVLGQRWIGRRIKQRYATSAFVGEIDYPELEWRVGYVQAAKVWTTVPARFRPFLRQQVRWKKSFVRNVFFSGRFMWRRGAASALLYYGHVLWVLIAPVMAVRHLIWAPLNGLWFLMVLYLCGISVKGTAWAIAFKVDNPGSTAWRYRPLMSLLSAVVLSWLLPYSLATIRRDVWIRGSR